MTTSTDHPLVVSYLAELDRLLQGVDPVERAETLAGVSEHIELALDGRDASEAVVRAVLAELGPATAIAGSAYGDRALVAAHPPTRVTNRRWLPIVVACLQGVGLLVAILVLSGMMGFAMSGSESSSGGPVGVMDDGSTGQTAPVEEVPAISPVVVDPGSAWTRLVAAPTAFLSALAIWLPTAVLVALTMLWTAREKTAQILLLPAAIVILVAAPEIAYAITRSTGAYFATTLVALALVAIGTATMITTLTRRALRRVE